MSEQKHKMTPLQIAASIVLLICTVILWICICLAVIFAVMPFWSAVIGLPRDVVFNGTPIAPWLANLPGLLIFTGLVFLLGCVVGRASK